MSLGLPSELYAGQYTDAESGFYYDLRARYYDPAAAQFLSRDPLVALTGSAYSYVHDDPLNLVDPSGVGEAVCDDDGGNCPMPLQGLETALKALGWLLAALASHPSGPLTYPQPQPTYETPFGRSSTTVPTTDDDCPWQYARPLSPEQETRQRELLREGSDLLGRTHSPRGAQRWRDWWDTLSPTEKDLYRRGQSPHPRRSTAN
jgi:RHS repeat-associated protein